MGQQEVDIEGFSEWLKKEERAENTIRSYVTAVKDFYSRYQQITKESMIDYKKAVMKKYAPSTASLRCIAMNRYCHYIGTEDARVKAVRVGKQFYSDNVISIDEYYKLLNSLKADGNLSGYWMCVLLAKTGVRVSELVAMKKDCLEKGFFDLYTKGRIRRIYIPNEVATECMEYVKEENKTDYLITNKYGEQITREGVRERLQRYAKRYGIRKEVMHPHSFRHLFAIQFLKHDKDVSLLADLMGHADINTTARYTRLTSSQQASRLNQQATEW